MKKNNSESNVNGTKKNKNKVNKKKKDKTKSTIDSPFHFNWPSIDYGVYSGIVSSLGKSFDNYVNKIRKQVQKTEGSLNLPTAKDKNATKKLLARADPPCIVFGYNAVMRGLEKGKIKCVFVNSEVKPAYLTKAFIPVCKLRNIPLLRISNLVQNFEKQISNKSTLAVGLTAAVLEENAPFHDLYTKCCKAVGFESSTEGGSKLNLIEKQIKKSRRVFTTDINSFHLKRDNKLYRVFKPSADASSNISFIKFETSNAEAKRSVNKPEMSKVKKDEYLSINPSECSFFIDTGSDAEVEEEPESTAHPPQRVCNKPSTSRYFSSLNSTVEDGSAKRKKPNYIPTQIKRIKGNPKRY